MSEYKRYTEKRNGKNVIPLRNAVCGVGMMKFIIKTNKGYICEKNSQGYYENSNNEFYRIETGKWFTSVCSGCDKVDKLGFTLNESEATKYSGHLGNRVNEIIDRIKFGYENINEITIKAVKE